MAELRLDGGVQRARPEFSGCQRTLGTLWVRIASFYIIFRVSRSDDNQLAQYLSHALHCYKLDSTSLSPLGREMGFRGSRGRANIDDESAASTARIKPSGIVFTASLHIVSNTTVPCLHDRATRNTISRLNMPKGRAKSMIDRLRLERISPPQGRWLKPCGNGTGIELAPTR